MKKTVLSLIVIAGLAAVYLVYGKQSPEPDQNSASHAFLQAGPYGVRHRKLRLVDESRTIPANGEYAGSDTRSFDLHLWSPKHRPGQPMPLVVYSHGFMSTGQGGSYLGEHLASYGYTFAAATFPLTNYSAPGGPNIADVVNQPADVSFIIDTLLRRNANPDDGLYQTIDSSRIVAAGLSLGGMTSKLAAYHPERADLRIIAAISIAGPAYPFSKRFFSDRDIPFMMIATPQDAMVSFGENARDILEKVDKAMLVTVEGASHAGFSATAKWLRFFDNPDSLGCKALKQNVDMSGDNSWFELLGSPEIGVVVVEPDGLCEQDPLPPAMNPLRQHQITTLAVHSFLQCHLLRDSSAAKPYCDFLVRSLPAEWPEVSVATAP